MIIDAMCVYMCVYTCFRGQIYPHWYRITWWINTRMPFCAPHEKRSLFLLVVFCWNKLKDRLRAPVCILQSLWACLWVFCVPGTQETFDSSINRIWCDKMNHINEDHNLLTFPSCFSSSHLPLFYGEPVQRLNCHCTVRPWQAALIHDAVAPWLIHPAREDVLQA